MESGNRGRLSIKILILGILISYEVINNCKGAGPQKGTQSSSAGKRPVVHESQRKGDIVSSNTISLLNKLAAVMESMKAEIVCEVATLMANQSKEIKKIATDIKNGQQLILDQIKKTDSSIIANLFGIVSGIKDCCAKQANKRNIDQQLMLDIQRILANFTIQGGKRNYLIRQKKSREVNVSRGAVRSQLFDPQLENFGNRWANASWTMHNARTASACSVDSNHQRAAPQKGTQSSSAGRRSLVRESQRNGDIISSDTSLLYKLIAVMEGMKAQIDCEVTLLLAKQSKEIQKIANDIKNGQQLIMDQIKKTYSSLTADLSVKVYYEKDCCTKQSTKINIDQQLLLNIQRILANFTIQAGTSSNFTSQNESSGASANKTETPPRPVYEDCTEIKRMGHPSGPYLIRLNNESIDVYCDFVTPDGDWLVFQRRRDGNVSFLKDWYEYERGFGNVSLDFWLGNENLYQLTSKGKYKLRVDLENFETQVEKRFALYDSFSIGPSSDKYRLNIGRYWGSAGDSLDLHRNLQFSTEDADYDTWSQGNCARVYHGGWWYGACHSSNLNGVFYHGLTSTIADGITWTTWGGLYYSLKSEMKMSLLN